MEEAWHRSPDCYIGTIAPGTISDGGIVTVLSPSRNGACT